MPSDDREARFAALAKLFNDEIKKLIYTLQNDCMEHSEPNDGLLFDIRRAAHLALSYHLGTLEGLLKAKMKEEKIPVQKLMDQRKKYIEKGLKHADHHMNGACTDCSN